MKARTSACRAVAPSREGGAIVDRRSTRTAFIVAVLSFTATVGYNVAAQNDPASAPAAQAASARQTPAVAPAAQAHQAVLQKYCVTCHNEKLKSGGLALSTLDLASVSKDVEPWEHVIRKVRTGAMPPVGRPRPDKAAAESLVTYLETELDRTAFENPNPGRLSLQRLNRAEYRNAIRDLLGVEIDAASMLPADVAGHGFDNNADALTLSGALTERYLGAAARISQMALARPRGLPVPETFFVPTDRNQGTRVSDDLPFGSRGGLAFRYYFPADGEYLFEMRPKESGAGGGFEGITAEPHQLDASLDNVKVWTGTLGGPEYARGRGEAAAAADEYRADRNKKILDMLRFRVPVKAGSHLVQVYFAAKTSAYVEDLFDPSLRRDPYRAGAGEPKLSSVTITGPQPETAAIGDTPSRRRVLICLPSVAAEQAACAKKILSTIARRAYRRPVTDADLQVPLASYRDGASRGGFESGIEMGIRSILVSPKFLFRFEGQPAAMAPNTPYRITDLDFASRLSFFLWSSIPDDELLELAVKKNLQKPEVLQQQIRRMLTDPRSQALVDNFAGQWLFIRNVAMHQPSPEVLFHFDDNLRKAFERETQLFFESIIHENRSVIDLLGADYTFLNERLAKHYGVPGVRGERFRRVTLPPDSVRGGLLGQGSILMATSYSNRTSPVIRGKWILENVFGAPPPPPPPNVPELKDERDPRKVLPMREQLAAHRANPACAGCHAQMDQLGFALENFDGIGEWRDIYISGARVDASAQLPDGTKFNGPAELRKVLLSHSDEFLTTITEKLLTYALGRGLEASDAPAVRKIKREAARGEYRFASLIQGIVTSIPFTMRMAVEDAN
jgi:mono/diheme cytochrome c family protein